MQGFGVEDQVFVGTRIERQGLNSSCSRPVDNVGRL